MTDHHLSITGLRVSALNSQQKRICSAYHHTLATNVISQSTHNRSFARERLARAALNKLRKSLRQ